MATVNGTAGNDFIHVVGDGFAPPAGYVDFAQHTTNGDDTINPAGGDDIVHAGGGNDVFQFFGGEFTPKDVLDGGAGNDLLILDGDYSATVQFLATTMTNIERISVTAGHSYTLYLAEANIAAGQTLTIDGASLGINDTLHTQADSETDGSMVIYGGAGTDYLHGGGGILDVIQGRGGDDFLEGNAHTNKLDGGDGNDEISAQIGGSINSIFGGKGNDQITVNGGTILSLDGGLDNDTVSLSNVTVKGQLVGGAGFDGLNLTGPIAFLEPSFSAAASGFETVFHSNGAPITGDVTNNLISFGSVTMSPGSVGFTIDGLGGNDTLVGSSLADALIGNTGNDLLHGGAGGDNLNGGAGTDTADYSGPGAGVNVSLITNTGTGGDAQGDSLSGIENLIGSGQGDTLTGDTGINSLDGGAGADSLSGGGGNDILRGGAGADSIDGGVGIDKASYAGSVAGVNVSLLTHTGTAGDAAGDSLTGIENLTGSAQGDTLAGDNGANSIDGGLGTGADSISGGGGNDSLSGGLGADSLDGGAGTGDYAFYTTSTAAVNVSLATGLGTGGDAAGDSLTGIEHLWGSAFNDSLTGDGNANLLVGGSGTGADSLSGGAGNDTLIGGGGNDTMTGGADADHFVFTPGSGLDTITDFHHAEHDIIDLTAFNFASTDDALSHATSSGGNTFFDLDGNPATHEITVLGVTSLAFNDVAV